MITVYGADWCEDTRRSLRHLRRLGVPHRYQNVDEDLDALHRATSLNGGRSPDAHHRSRTRGRSARRTRQRHADRGSRRGRDALAGSSATSVSACRTSATSSASVVPWSASRCWPPAPRRRGALRWPLRFLGAGVALTGVTGWCPVYRYAGVTSLGGPGDRPDEAMRLAWLTPVTTDVAVTSAPPGAEAEP